MTIRAYAKINLGLLVLRKRDDGYHDVETVLHRINWFDEIALEPSSTISLSTDRHDLPTDESNLCVRAASLLQKTFGAHQGVHIKLKKNIPIGAGLGGGSSDAAAVLRALPELWDERLADDELLSLAAELGSDVAYFLKPGTAHAMGRGEILDYFPFDFPYWLVVAYPDLHISTGWAYRNVEVRDTIPKTSLKEILRENLHSPRSLGRLLQNDFEPLVLRTHEVVARLKKSLDEYGAVFTQLSGSGSSVYGLFETESYALLAAKALGEKFPVSLSPPHFTPAF